jgi:hypothetical protein
MAVSTATNKISSFSRTNQPEKKFLHLSFGRKRKEHENNLLSKYICGLFLMISIDTTTISAGKSCKLKSGLLAQKIYLFCWPPDECLLILLPSR